MASKVQMKMSAAVSPDAGPDLADAIAAVAEYDRLTSRAQAADDRATAALDAHRAAMEALEAAPDDPAAQQRLMVDERAAGDAVRHTAALARGADRAVHDHRAVLRATLAAGQRTVAAWADAQAARIEAEYQAMMTPLVAFVRDAAGFSQIMDDALPGSTTFIISRTLTSGVHSAADKVGVGHRPGDLTPTSTLGLALAGASTKAVLSRIKALLEAKDAPSVSPVRDEPGISGPSATGGYLGVPVAYAVPAKMVEFVEGSDPSL